MNIKPWTKGLAAAGLISIGSLAQAEEAPSAVITKLSSTRLGGYVDTSFNWMTGRNGHTPAKGGAAIPGRSFDGASKQNGFNFNVAKLSLSKPSAGPLGKTTLSMATRFRPYVESRTNRQRAV